MNDNQIKIERLTIIDESYNIISKNKQEKWIEFVLSVGSNVENIELIRVILLSIRDINNNASYEEVFDLLDNNRVINENQLSFVKFIVCAYSDKCNINIEDNSKIYRRR